MRNKAKASLWILLTGFMMFVAVGCGEQKRKAVERTETNMLVVERQQAQLSRSVEDGSYTYYDDFTIDIPLYGPKLLMDSLKVFLNKELYKAFDMTVDEANLSEKELFQDDFSGMLAYYAAKYKPYEKNINNHFAVSLLLIAQSESYVTYGLEFSHCGANCGSEFYCYTFGKKDGRQCEIINRENLIKYAEKYHSDYQPVYDDYSDHFSFGLLEDGLLGAEQEASNHHYVPYRIEVDEMLPYLSKEAQKLIQAKGDIAKYGFGDWSLGKRLGEAETVDGDEVVLMQRMPRWGFEEHEYEESIFEDNEDGDSPEVIAYSIKDGLYVPSESRYKTLAFIGETKDCLIRIDNIGDTYRYAVWKHKFNMDDEPDLVVNNGWFDSEGAYVFENNGYGYMVEAVQTSFVTPNLYVYHGKKQLSKQPLTILEECYENTNIEFLPLGKVTGSDGSTIRLVKCVQTAYGASVSYNYFLKALSGGDVPVEKKIFETTTPTGEKCYQANTNTISSHSQWVSTSPDGGYYAFNEEDNTLYCACNQDLFEVYQFDGTHFNFVRKAGGFWLHPCLRSFVRLVNIYETKGFVIRVDKTGEEGNNCRYAVWKKGTESYPGIMAQSPDLVIDNGQLDNVMIGSSEYNVSKFEDEGYQYIVDESKRELTVNKGKNLVLKQKIENILIN